MGFADSLCVRVRRTKEGESLKASFPGAAVFRFV